jgi:hypothetical protein
MAQVDYIAYHPYMPTPETSLGIYDNFKYAVERYGFADKIWITEVGYPTKGHMGTEIPEADFPEAVVKTVAYLTAAGAKTLFWYHLKDDKPPGDPSDDAEHWFGLLQNDYSPKKGAPAWELCAANLSGKTCLPMISHSLPSHISAYYFSGSDGAHTLVVCNTRPSQAVNLTVELPGRNHKKYDIVSGAAVDVASSIDTVIGSGPESVLFFTWDGASSPPNIKLR